MLTYGVILVLLVRFLPLGIVSSLSAAIPRAIDQGAGPRALAHPQPDGTARGAPSASRSELPLSNRALAVRDLAVQFGGVSALAGVSFDVRPGSITSLIGPNGAGKTTAFNAITGYLRVVRGQIGYGGATLNGLRPSAIARLGVVRTFQKTSVFPALTVMDNVMIGLHLRGRAGLVGVLSARRWVRDEEARLRTEAERLIAFVGLDRRRHAVASALAYGEQRLVELAVALAARPALLLLDEPAAGLAGAERDAVSDLVRRIREQGIGVLLVEHDMRMVMGISDTVVVLDHGVVIAEGPPTAIQSHPEVVRAYLGSAAAQA
jgi:branched-chain amino acid transport system ATP-binding protein